AWHHIAYTYDGATHRLYIDGVQAGTSTTAADAHSLTTAEFGRWPAGTNYFAGKLDETRIFTRALSAVEVSTLAGNATAPIGALLPAGGAAPENMIECLAFLTAPGTLAIELNGKVSTMSAPAGLTSFKIPLEPGRPTFRLVRGNDLTINMRGPWEIRNNVTVQDLLYRAGSNTRAFVPFEDFIPHFMETVNPPSNLMITKKQGGMQLAWTASTSPGIDGYYVYRATTAVGPYQRITATPVAATSYTDMALPQGDVWYLVAAVDTPTTALVESDPIFTHTSNLRPTLPQVSAPNPAPTLPGAMDVFTPPVGAVTPTSTAPAIAEATRTGGPDQSLAITGEGFTRFTGADTGKDTRFEVYAQTTAGDAAFSTAKLQRLDGQFAAVTLDSALPSWGMYLMWPQNGDGYGAPVAVNRTDAWWLGPKKATQYQVISVFGRNLSHDNGTGTAWVYLKQTSGGAYTGFVTPSTVDPYKVSFAVPAGCTSGTYEVWAHNGHGGSYGWSGPLTLTVYNDPGWTSTEFNVTAYGATGGDTTDDTTAIQHALNAAAASTGSTVYFPSGTYYISARLTPPSNVRWRGQSKATTIIRRAAASTQTALLFGEITPRSNVEIRELTFDTNGASTYINGSVYSAIYLRSYTDVKLEYCDFNCLQNRSVDFWGSTNVSVNACQVRGRTLYTGATQVFINDVDFYGTDDATALNLRQANEVCITNCTVQHADTGQTWGSYNGRFIYGQADMGLVRDIYIGGNITYNLRARSAGLTGEQVSFTLNNFAYRGAPTAATSTTVTFSDLVTDYTNYEAVIVQGKGLGQHRTITGWNSGTKTITLGNAWNVIPDATSALNIQRVSMRTVIYHNTFDGVSPLVDDPSMQGIVTGAGCLDIVADFNTLSDLRYGINTGASAKTDVENKFRLPIPGINTGSGAKSGVDANLTLPTYFNLFTRNTITNNKYAIYSSVTSFGSAGVDGGTALLGQVFRGNTIITPTVSALQLVSSWNGAGEAMQCNIYEGNTGTNIPVAVDCTPGTNNALIDNTLFYKNNFDRGTAALLGSKGINFAAGQAPDLRENRWTNFATTYAGTLPGAILEVPARVLELTAATDGTSPTTMLSIWNAGTASQAWSATKSAAWLTLSLTSGALATENSSANVTVTGNPTGLAPGTYTDVITVTGASQTQKVTVLFNVTAPAQTPANVTNLTDGLQAYWKLNENSGMTTTDQTGYAHTGTLYAPTQTPTWTTGIEGAGLAFDGNDLVSIANPTLVKFDTPLAITWWMKVPGFGGTQVAVCPSNADLNAALDCGIKNNTVTVWKYDGTVLVSAPTVPTANVWHHYAYTFDGTTHRLYVDGVEVNSSTVAPHTVGTNRCHLGGWFTGMSYLVGQLDEVRIYTRTLSLLDLNAMIGDTTTGLLAHWQFNAGSGASAVDETGSHTATLLGTTKWTSGYEFGGLYFSGASDAYVRAASPGTFPANNAAQTVSWWMNLPSYAGNEQTAVSLGNDPLGSAINCGVSNGMVRVWGYGLVTLVEATAPSANAWHHYAYTFDGTTHRLYIDGVEVNNSTVAPQTAVPTAVILGRWSAPICPLRGKLDQVRVYNRALGAKDIRLLSLL
ncbi:MAG TPA: LamG-like jellyroll fold domain-containing protein, partial [Armatimonadota bacterium]